MNEEFIKREVFVEKLPIIRKIIIIDNSPEHSKFIEDCIEDFIYKKTIKEIKHELKEMLFKHEWLGHCPAPLGTMHHHRKMMQMYIPNEFKKVCEEYLDEYWCELNEKQRNHLEKWAYECHS